MRQTFPMREQSVENVIEIYSRKLRAYKDKLGAMTLSLTTFSLMPFSLTTLSLMTLSITTLSITA